MAVFTPQVVSVQNSNSTDTSLARELFKYSVQGYLSQDPSQILAVENSAQLVLEAVASLYSRYQIPIFSLINGSNVLCVSTSNFNVPQELDPLFNTVVGLAAWHFVSKNSRSMPEAKNIDHQEALEGLDKVYNELALSIANYVIDNYPNIRQNDDRYCIRLNRELVVRLDDLFKPGIFYSAGYPISIEKLTNTAYEFLVSDDANFRAEVSQVSLLTEADLDMDPFGKFLTYSAGTLGATLLFPPIQPVVTLATLYKIIQSYRTLTGQEILEGSGDIKEVRDQVFRSSYAGRLPFNMNDLQKFTQCIHDQAISRKSEIGLVTLGAPVGTCVLGILCDDFGWERI